MLTSASEFDAQAQIPRGVADYFWDEAYARRRLESMLLEVFRSWGYQDVIPPMFEYADTFLHRSSPKLQAELYRFLDRDGSTLTLRADMTIPVARLVGVRLHDRPMPQRFCYAGSVFRHAETQAGRQREFTQAGFELIGAATPAADAEVIALTIAALQTARLGSFRLVLGNLEYFNGLMQDLQLNASQTDHLLRAIDRNSEAELDDFLRTTPLRTQQRHTVEQLPLLSGADPQKIIAHADRLCLNYTMHKALANLRAIYEHLHVYGVTDQVYLDLTEIRNLGYYTGISFEIFVPGVGFSVGGGGRYDNLVGTFGAPQPAVGVALGIDRLLNVQHARTPDDNHSTTTPHILVDASNSATCLALVGEWRRNGLRVVMSVDDAPPQEIWHAAQQAGVPLAARWTGEGFDIYGVNQDTPSAATHLAQAEANTIFQHVKATRRQSHLPTSAGITGDTGTRYPVGQADGKLQSEGGYGTRI